MRTPTLGAAMLVRDVSGQALVIQRGQGPQAGRWAVPGGHVEWGESLRTAASRELWEECGVRADVECLLHVAEIIDSAAGIHFVVADFGARVNTPAPVTLSSEAVAYQWISHHMVKGLPWARGMEEFWTSPKVRQFLDWPE